MSRASSNIMLALCVIFVLHITRSDAVSPVFTNGSFPALLAFGDSILDTGNNNLLSTLSKCNFPPYGKDFPGGIPTERFGNGKVFSDLIAEHLGIKATLPAFLDPTLKDQDLVTGVCFASGGSGLDTRTAQLQNILSMSKQIDLFKQYVGKLKGYVGTEKAEAIVSESLYLVSAGNNDIAITYFSFIRNDIDGYTTQLVSWASTFIQDMYGLGARKFAYLTTLPLGCLPSARIMAGGVLRSCFEAANQAAALFNSKLQAEINKLNNSLPGANIVLLDVYNPLLELIQNPNKYVKNQIEQTVKLELHPLENNSKNNTPCTDDVLVSNPKQKHRVLHSTATKIMDTTTAYELNSPLTEELDAIRKKMERLRMDKEKTEKLLKEREALMHLQFEEINLLYCRLECFEAWIPN